MDTHVQSWAQKFREHSDSDATIQSMGKYFTCTYMLDMETAKVIVDMRDGKVNDINVNPAPSIATNSPFGQVPPRGKNLAWRRHRQCSMVSGRLRSGRI